MSYFKNYPNINYKFGNEATSTSVQDLGAYVDLFDRVKDDISYYEEYNLRDGDRPDQVSNYLYGSPDYHWTFYLLNDDLKRRGWPLTRTRISDKAKEEYPNIAFTTRANISEQFLIGSDIEGQTSGVTGKILRRRPDMGQIIVEKTTTEQTFTGTPDTNSDLDIELTSNNTFVNSSDWVVTNTTTNTVVTDHTIVISTDKTEATIGNLTFGFNYSVVTKILTNANFVKGEAIITTENEVEKNIIVDSVVDEYNAKHHYEDTSGNYVDIAPNAPFIQRVSYEITWDGSGTEATDFTIDDIKISNLTSIFTDFSLDEVTTQTILGNVLPGGSALVIAGLLQAAFNNDDDYTVDDWQSGFLVGTLGLSTEFQNVVSLQLGAIVNGIAAAGGTSPTSIVYHTFTLVDNQLNIFDSTTSVPQYIAFEFRSDVDVDFSTVLSGAYTLMPFNTDGNDILANDTADEDERNFMVYKNVGNIGSPATGTPFLTSKTTDGVSTLNSAFTFVQNAFETYIATNYDDLIPATIVPVTFLERYEKENEEVRPIKVLRPEIIVQFDTAFKRILSESTAEQIEDVIGTISGDTSFTSVITTATLQNQATGASSSSSSSGGGSSY